MISCLPSINLYWFQAPWCSRSDPPHLNPWGHCPYVTCSLVRGWVCLLWIGFSFVKCMYCTCSMLLKSFSLWAVCKSSVSPGFAEQITSISLTLCYIGNSLVTWTIVSLTAATFKPLLSPLSGFALSYAANVFIFMLLYDLCLLSAQFFL
jgi:hypothetical protein